MVDSKATKAAAALNRVACNGDLAISQMTERLGKGGITLRVFDHQNGWSEAVLKMPEDGNRGSFSLKAPGTAESVARELIANVAMLRSNNK